MKPLEGFHLLLDAHGPQLRVECLGDYLRGIVALLKMVPVSAAPGYDLYANGDITAFMVIAESHISVHFKPLDRYWIDIFSCRQFDVAAACEYTTQRLGLRDVETRLIMRGQGVPIHAI